MNNTSIILMGSLAGTCLMASVALANPGLLPEHPNYPMKESKSPVTGQPTANDPGQELMYGQKAMSAATKKSNEGMVLRSRDSLMEGNQSEGQDQMGGQKKMGDKNQTGGQSQMGGQKSMGGQDQMGN